LPLELQAKLLRVLQEGEFERLGNPKTIKVDVRLIAATNRNLSAEVKKGKFREDLYYRLKVFPIDVPPLRTRPEDIPALVWCFIDEFSEKMGKKIRRLPKGSLETLQRYHWPGNVRELRNLIEQAFILSGGDLLRISMPKNPVEEVPSTTLEEAESRHILETLEKCRWRIKGAQGAAQMLGIKPSTLYSKMKKLSIPTRNTKDDI
jgi:formate hydrogenlyase transcriptional activator